MRSEASPKAAERPAGGGDCRWGQRLRRRGPLWSDMEPPMGLSAEDTLLEFPSEETLGLLSLSHTHRHRHRHTHTHTHTHTLILPVINLLPINFSTHW